MISSLKQLWVPKSLWFQVLENLVAKLVFPKLQKFWKTWLPKKFYNLIINQPIKPQTQVDENSSKRNQFHFF
jgi:hypothetical protein